MPRAKKAAAPKPASTPAPAKTAAPAAAAKKAPGGRAKSPSPLASAKGGRPTPRCQATRPSPRRTRGALAQAAGLRDRRPHRLTPTADHTFGYGSRPLRIGVPIETAPDERRVALVPEIVRKLTGQGHEVVIEAGAGAGAGLPDALYTEAGATTGDP